MSPFYGLGVLTNLSIRSEILGLSLSLSPFSYTFTSVLVLGQGYSYSRTNNPTVTVLEEKLAKLENGCGTCVRSP